ncbi:hypothetical protein D3C81_2297660 [compost metagenome]
MVAFNHVCRVVEFVDLRREGLTAKILQQRSRVTSVQESTPEQLGQYIDEAQV